ncbi:MAG: FMN-binding glutamate synthase family protein [Myxococcales bacterium FL481]|nr:MAG: FMN-binding glutamate synthase family protein [Myxococcales bacterium FL481]
MRRFFFVALLGWLAFSVVAANYFPTGLWASAVLAPLAVLGVHDVLQTRHTVLRNFPIVGHGRYLLEAIRPEINQYFVESNIDGRPFHREHRAIAYQRAKREVETLPFGTKIDVYEPGYEWVNHSLAPTHVDPAALRTTIGSRQCQQPYSASILNISAMSYGSLSHAAIRALNAGAAAGNFAHNTGEGGVSPYHLEPRGDLIWQIGTGYFGCRRRDGSFCPEAFAKVATGDTVKMIEIKLSQGAKPGHGGILPGAKVTAELAQIRGCEVGKTVSSPPAHGRFSTPVGLLEFVQELRETSGGKPVGFKLCLGQPHEFLAICKAMEKTGILPDFVTIDGAEGGTGAAPLEFSNAMGTPLVEGLIFVRNALVGTGVRDQIKIICSGRIITGFDVIKRLALGADACASARGMMFALGCIQALRCNDNACPTGIATQRPELVAGIHIPSKSARVASFHGRTLEAVAELLGAMGLEHPRDLRPRHVQRRVRQHEVRHYGELYSFLETDALRRDPVPTAFAPAWIEADPTSFDAAVTARERSPSALH